MARREEKNGRRESREEEKRQKGAAAQDETCFAFVCSFISAHTHCIRVSEEREWEGNSCILFSGEGTIAGGSAFQSACSPSPVCAPPLALSVSPVFSPFAVVFLFPSVVVPAPLSSPLLSVFAQRLSIAAASHSSSPIDRTDSSHDRDGLPISHDAHASHPHHAHTAVLCAALRAAHRTAAAVCRRSFLRFGRSQQQQQQGTWKGRAWTWCWRSADSTDRELKWRCGHVCGSCLSTSPPLYPTARALPCSVISLLCCFVRPLHAASLLPAFSPLVSSSLFSLTSCVVHFFFLHSRRPRSRPPRSGVRGADDDPAQQVAEIRSAVLRSAAQKRRGRRAVGEGHAN